MVPAEILEDIFAYLSRDALDHCEIICLKWSKLIETSKRLTQRRIVSLEHYYGKYFINDPNGRFWVELKSSTGKTFHIADNPNHPELPASRFFKNIIFDELVEEEIFYNIDRLEKQWMKIFKLAGVCIIVNSVRLYFAKHAQIENIMLKQLHDSLPKYIDADEIKMSFSCPGHEDDEDEVLFNKESWKYFDFGKKTEFNLHYNSNILPNDFSNDTFKEFISGKYMEHPTLNELQIYFDEIDKQFIFKAIIEAFCNTDKPLKFFKSITTYPTRNFDEIVGEFGFVRDDMDHQKYRLSHPRLKWSLEATQSLDKCSFQDLKFTSIEL